MSPSLTGDQLPHLRTPVPGPASRALVDHLARHECPAITARRARRAASLGAADDDPFVWAEAVGANVADADGNVFVDLTAGFAVALLGHRHPDIVSAAEQQIHTLIHAMGDAWSDATRIELLTRLAAVAPGDLEVSILGLSGADAVDGAIKTAVLATGREGVLTFEGGYHGLSLGVVGLQGYKAAFTEPFRGITHPAVSHLPWAATASALEGRLARGDIGLVMVEPLQGRGGIRPAPEGWLAELARITRRHGALLAFDEIQCGLGRTGTMWAADHDGVVPDLLCTGKALAGGFPLSATIGSRAVMDAWGASKGEALHTQTFLGHPVGCAAAVALLHHLSHHDVPAQVTARGDRLTAALAHAGFSTRGRGLMLGVEVGPHGLTLARALQARGFIVLPAGARADVLALTPPLCLTDAQQDAFVLALTDAHAEVAS